MNKLYVLLATPLLGAAACYGQAISVNGGSIQGTITDATGAVVPSATIVIRGVDTGSVKTLATDSAGFYSVGPLNPGSYIVEISAPGFQKTAVTTVVRTGTATSGNFKIALGSSTETVEVNAGALQVNTEQAGVSDVITHEQIESLPVNGRNFLDLAQIEPGVILQSGESFDPTKAGYSAISVSGVSGRTTRILLDGQDITDETVGTTIFNVSAGAINEFQLNRSTQDVSGEVTATGQVLVSTNSGTNKVHGSAFYQFQDHRALFARSLNAADPQFQRNQFGGSVGGPILRDKLFFFANSERIKQDSASVSQVSTGVGSFFSAIQNQYPVIPTPYRETYSTVRLDYNGPLSGHYFVRANYNVNSVASNYGLNYSLYANRDNTPGLAGGADFSSGKFTHSFRGSYEKFHNLITDLTAGNAALYNPLPGFEFYNTAQHLFAGPNYLAPQGTFQSDKQFRYDGSWTKGKHNVRFGYSLNRIQGGGFASFFGLSPRASETTTTQLTGVVSTANPLGLGCNGVVGGPTCYTDPINGYHINTAIIGNGQGYFTEHSGFGLPGGEVSDWREGAYVQESLKATPHMTLIAGLRYSVDTGRANQDLPTPLCSDVDAASIGNNPCGSASGSTPLFSLYGSQFGSKVHQSYGNFGPQLGFNYSPGNGKTSFRGGVGIFFESDVFNNTTNARNSLLKSGAFFDDRSFCAGGGVFSVTIPGQTAPITSVNGQSIYNLCYGTVKNAAPAFIQLQQMYQTATKANSTVANGSYVGATGYVNGVYGAPYRTPYSEQYNFGVQQEIVKGTIISADYVHNSTLKIAQTVDQNHVGAARTLNVANAQAALATTATALGCTGAGNAALINCAIAKGATIQTFAGNGLDSGNQYSSGYPSTYVGQATPAAFAGINPNLGNGNFLLPIGRSGYDALQIVFKQVKAHPAPGVDSVNFQASYSLSRIVSTGTNAGQGGSDAFFSSAAADNDNPNQFIGRAGLDHKHQINFGGSITAKYGPRIGLIGHFYSAAPSSLTLDNTQPIGGIFQSDITGDGTIGDYAPGTLPGDYMHRVKPAQLNSYLTNFNSTYAGKLTPAGQALVNAGLFTTQQLVALNATIQPVALAPQATGIQNPTTRSLDANFSYPIRMNRLHEGMSLEPVIAFYNVFNMANYTTAALTSTLLTQSNAGGLTNSTGGYVTGPNSYDVLNSNRTQRGSGTFDQGGPRSTEFQLKLNF